MGIFDSDDEESRERRIAKLQGENAEADVRLSLAEKRAMEREAKRRYGSDWKDVMGIAGKFISSRRVNPERLHDLHGMGVDTERRLRDSHRIPSRRHSRYT